MNHSIDPVGAAQPREAREAILRAAVAEFADQGVAGARMDAIARAAGVNKALLHYYFGSKDGLHAAVLERVFTGLLERYLTVLNGPGTPGERLLRYFLAHFDHLTGAGAYTRLMGHEMMRARAGDFGNVQRISELAFKPVHARLLEVYREGAGELRALDPDPAVLALTGANVFYFISAPFIQAISGLEPRDPARLARQRAALLDLAGTVLFADPEQGRRVAARIYAESPESPDSDGGRP
jgi:TetR/AcrR family transcriptional regulator